IMPTDPGSRIPIYYGPDKEETYAVTIRSIEIHPDYDDAADHETRSYLAVITVRETTPDIAIAPINYSTVTEGTTIFLNGYGCEGDIHYSPANTIRGLKWAKSYVSEVKSGVFGIPRMNQIEEHARLCPEDSG